MKYFYLFGCFLITLSGHSKNLIENFDSLSDSLKDAKVFDLLKENRSNLELEKRVEGIQEIALFCQSYKHLPTEALAISTLYITYAEAGMFDKADEVSTLIDAKYFTHLLPQHQLRLNLYRSQPLISKGQLEEAIELAQHTLAICAENNLPKSNVYGLLSTIYTSLGKYDDALEMDKDNLTDILNNYPTTKYVLGQVYYSISRDFTNLNQLDSATYYGLKSFKHWTHPISYIQMGDIKTRLMHYDSARFYLLAAEEIITASPQWKSHETVLFLYLSRLEINQKNWEDGYDYSLKALNIGAAQNDKEVVHKAYENIIRSLLKNEGFYLDSLLSQNMQLRNQEVAETTIELDTKYKTLEKEKQIIALNSDLQEKEIKTLRFRNYLLYAGLSAAIIAILVFVFFWRRKVKNKKQVDALRKQALKLQMNPHFFFNSLNSIHNFIGNNNPQEAQKYLVNYSKLMRLTLENSQDDLIPIKKEIAFISNLLVLEQLRHKNFDFEINVPTELEEYKIPAFLIQPIVENSIIHGFDKIDYKGNIYIEIKKEPNNLYIVVTDNGVGWKKSISVEKENKKHTSFGIEILKKRISLYSANEDSIRVENGIAVDNNLGTKVSFKLSYLK